MRKCLEDFVVQGVRENGNITQLRRAHSLETPWAIKDCGDFSWATAISRIAEALNKTDSSKFLIGNFRTVGNHFLSTS